MSGEKDLKVLLHLLRPELLPEEFVFCTVSEEQRKKLTLIACCEFREREGVTLILTKTQAEAFALPSQYPCRQITLTIHSSLQAVGMIAAISSKLAQAGISVNPVSAYYHDHLFVPVERAEEALRLIWEL